MQPPPLFASSSFATMLCCSVFPPLSDLRIPCASSDHGTVSSFPLSTSTLPILPRNHDRAVHLLFVSPSLPAAPSLSSSLLLASPRSFSFLSSSLLLSPPLSSSLLLSSSPLLLLSSSPPLLLSPSGLLSPLSSSLSLLSPPLSSSLLPSPRLRRLDSFLCSRYQPSMRNGLSPRNTLLFTTSSLHLHLVTPKCARKRMALHLPRARRIP